MYSNKLGVILLGVKKLLIFKYFFSTGHTHIKLDAISNCFCTAARMRDIQMICRLCKVEWDST